MQILPDYLDYLENRNTNSILAKFYGVFKIKTKNNINNDEVIVIIMKNIARCSKNRIRKIYDLKGSISHR